MCQNDIFYKRVYENALSTDPTASTGSTTGQQRKHMQLIISFPVNYTLLTSFIKFVFQPHFMNLCIQIIIIFSSKKEIMITFLFYFLSLFFNDLDVEKLNSTQTNNEITICIQMHLMNFVCQKSMYRSSILAPFFFLQRLM